jgi:hypothetical protein
VVAGAAITLVLLAIAQLVALVRYEPGPYVVQGVSSVPAILGQQAPHTVRDVDAYAGYGTWVDVYDFAPSYQGRSGTPRVTPADIDAMASHGVRTLYLQAAQLDPRSPGPVADPGALAALLVRAQRAGMRVIGWYLPRFDDIDQDLAHLKAVSAFQVLGHRFDGVAVDIEWTDSVADPTTRNRRLVALSRRLRASNGRDALGAIVLPPVQTEVINPAKWPAFPWRKLAPSYDVWLPMGYWTERSQASGFKDGRTYTDENVRRLRTNLGEPNVPVHAIGGIGNQLTPEQAKGFVKAVKETRAIGASIYDWASLTMSLHDQIAAGLGG